MTAATVTAPATESAREAPRCSAPSARNVVKRQMCIDVYEVYHKRDGCECCSGYAGNDISWIHIDKGGNYDTNGWEVCGV